MPCFADISPFGCSCLHCCGCWARRAAVSGKRLRVGVVALWERPPSHFWQVVLWLVPHSFGCLFLVTQYRSYCISSKSFLLPPARVCACVRLSVHDSNPRTEVLCTGPSTPPESLHATALTSSHRLPLCAHQLPCRNSCHVEDAVRGAARAA